MRSRRCKDCINHFAHLLSTYHIIYITQLLMKDKLFRLIILFAGLVVAHLGVSLFLLADLGSDPFNVMIQGLSRTIDSPLLTHGNTHMSVSILFLYVELN